MVKESESKDAPTFKCPNFRSLKRRGSNTSFLLLGRRLLHKQPIRDTDYRIEGGSYICCHCENVYRSKDSVKSHIKYVHFNVRRRHCCPYCDLSFKYETPLTLHKLQAHNVDERTKCNACDAIYNSKERLVRHMQCFHQLGEKFKCDICTYETYDKRLFSIHIKYHKAERNFRCAHCGKSFKRKTNLRLHEKIHTNDKTKVCKECNKSFVQKASLNYHMTKYHPEGVRCYPLPSRAIDASLRGHPWRVGGSGIYPKKQEEALDVLEGGRKLRMPWRAWVASTLQKNGGRLISWASDATSRPPERPVVHSALMVSEALPFRASSEAILLFRLSDATPPFRVSNTLRCPTLPLPDQKWCLTYSNSLLLIPPKCKKAIILNKSRISAKLAKNLDQFRTMAEGRRRLLQKPIQDTDYRIEGESYICCHCEKICGSENLVRGHIKYSHFSIKKHRCPCCDIAFRYEGGLTVHKLEAHNIDDRKKCNACDAEFNSKEQLARHMRSFHKLGKNFKCDMCGYETYHRNTLYAHKKCHEAERNFRCGHCEKAFKRRKTLLLHEKIHTNDKRKVCKECNKSFVQKARRRLLPKQPIRDTDYRIQGESYVCCHCEKVFRSIDNVKDHIKYMHFDRKKYQCPYCDLAFKREPGFTVHKLMVHNKDDRKKCNACDATFNSEVGLRKHMRTFHMLGETYKCDVCEYNSYLFNKKAKLIFAASANFETRGRRLLPKQPIRDTDYRIQGESYACCHCEKVFRSIDNVKDHIKNMHFDRKKYQCPYCDLAFKREPGFTVHKLVAHNKDDRKKCNACDATFNSEVGLRKHMRTFHMLGETYKCDVCEYNSYLFNKKAKLIFAASANFETRGRRLLQKQPIRDTDYRIQGESYACCHCEKVFRSIDYVKDHIKNMHFDRKKYQCPYCDLAFKLEPGFTVHKLVAHDKDDRKKCNACDATFNSGVGLRKHMRSFHMLGETYKCDVCEYKSYSQCNLRRHKKRHEAERNFRCGHCGKSFKRKKNLRLHEKIHTNDKTKVCKECNKSFVQKASLNYHMTKYHPEVKF
ncbi:hypothetical protein NE865_13981 [Phthorimaea operculella]|nr:hypothetical protein NE865_13981 [Phthorimaea operculella]